MNRNFELKLFVPWKLKQKKVKAKELVGIWIQVLLGTQSSIPGDLILNTFDYYKSVFELVKGKIYFAPGGNLITKYTFAPEEIYQHIFKHYSKVRIGPSLEELKLKSGPLVVHSEFWEGRRMQKYIETPDMENHVWLDFQIKKIRLGSPFEIGKEVDIQGYMPSDDEFEFILTLDVSSTLFRTHGRECYIAVSTKKKYLETYKEKLASLTESNILPTYPTIWVEKYDLSEIISEIKTLFAPPRCHFAEKFLQLTPYVDVSGIDEILETPICGSESSDIYTFNPKRVFYKERKNATS